MTKTIAAIICAAGASSRFGEKKKKQLSGVAGRAAFLRSVEMFAARDDVKQIIVAIAPEDEEMVKIRWSDILTFHGARLCLGGRERFDTVANVLKLIKDDIDLIAVHDAARCCLKKEWLDKVIKTADQRGSAILACPVTATIKKCKDKTILETVDRTDLYEAQTPQVFNAAMLKKAYENLEKMDKTNISDDAQLIEALGETVAIVETDSSNIKITHSCDIAIAEAILKSRPKDRPKGPTGPYIEAQW